MLTIVRECAGRHRRLARHAGPRLIVTLPFRVSTASSVTLVIGGLTTAWRDDRQLVKAGDALSPRLQTVEVALWIPAVRRADRDGHVT